MTLRHLLLLLCVACAGSHAEGEAVDPAEAAAEVLSTLGQLPSMKPSEAQGAWLDAASRFDRVVEPALRQGCDPRRVTELEYGFARLGAAIGTASERRELDALIQGIEEQLGCLPKAP